MANYDIEARVRLVAGQALKGLQDLEQKAKKLQKSVEQLGDTKFNNISRGATGARKQVNDLYKAFQKLNRIGKISGLVGTTAALNAFGEQLAGATAQTTVFGKTFETGIPVINQMGSAVEGLTHFMAPLVHQLQAVGAQGQAVAAGLGIATAAAVAFAPQVSRLGAAARPLVEDLNQLRHKLLDFVEGSKTAIQFTGNYRDVIRSVTDNVANLTNRQQNAKRALNSLNSTSEEAVQVATTLVSLNNRLNRELANQETLLKNVANAQRSFNDQARVRANIERSSFGREGSGFGAFSQAASRVADKNAIDKAIRRNRDRIAKAFRGMEPIQAPLMLPSSEMLNAAERGIQQLSGFYGDLNTQIDTGVQAGRAFTEQLNAQAARSKTLPPIFSDVGRALEATVATTQNVFGNNEKTKKTVVDTNKLYGDSLKKTNAQIEAQKQLLQIENKKTEALKFQDQLAQKAGKRAESLALGVGFPLLFGGGPGAVAGGALGSFAGQGFGGQIIFSAIGQQIDAVVANIAKLGQALNPLTLDLNAVTAAAGLSGTQLERYINELKDSEGKLRAATEAQKALAVVVGDEGVDALEEFGTATQRLSNAFDRAMSRMAAGVARLINSIPGFLQFTANLERGAVLQRALASQDPAQAANLKRLEAARVGKGGVDINKQQSAIEALIRTQRTIEAGGGDREDMELLSRKLDIAKQQLAVTKAGTDLADDAVFRARQELQTKEHALRITEVMQEDLTDAARNAKFDQLRLQDERERLQLTRDRQAAVTKAAKAGDKSAARVAQEVSLLGIRNNLTETMLTLDAQIADAKRQGRIEDVENLERSKVLLQGLSKEAELRIRIKDAAQLQAEIRQNELNTAGKLNKLDVAKTDRLQKESDAVQNTLSNLDMELQGVQAISNSQKDVLRFKEIELDYISRGQILNEKDRKEIKGKIADIREATNALEEQQFIQINLNNLVNTAGQQFTGLFETLVNGTNDWNSALRNVLTSLSSALFRYGLSALGGNDGVGLFSILSGTFTGGKRAQGGPVMAGTPYLVGERGPELFIPKAGGNIVPNNALGMGGANIVVNVDAKGTQAQGNQPNSAALGRAIGAAVQAELIKQKRPGGLLA